MRDLIKSRNFKLLIATILVVLGLMMYSASNSGNQNFLTSVASFITTPIQKLTALISGGINDLTDDMTDIDTIRAENELLLQKARELQSQMVDYEELKQENETLRQLLELKKENDDYQFLAGTVIARDSTNTYYTFIIDKGSMQGVSYLDPVITADGLVGYVSEVGPISSKVTTILSSASDVGAIDRRTLDGGILTGDFELARNGYAKLSYLARDCDVAAGDIIVTSGLGGIYPKNLIIGEVVEIKAESQDISLYAIIDPSADILGCYEVYVITHFSGQGSVIDGELADHFVSATDAP